MSLTRIVAGLALVTNARAAWALSDSDKEAVRNLSDEAAADFDARRYEPARDKFARAYAVAQIPSLALWMARANEKLGHLVVAYEEYLQATSLERNELWRGDAQQKAQKEAEREAQKLLPRIPKLTVRLEGVALADVSVTIDGVTIPSALVGVERLADAGDHQIVGQRGDETQRERVSLREGGKAEVVLRFASAAVATDQPKPEQSGTMPLTGPASPAPVTGALTAGVASPMVNAPQPESTHGSQRTWGWVGIGVGAVGVAFGSITGALVLSKYGTLKDKCNDNRHCDATLQSDVSGYRTMRNISTAGFIVGGIATAAGVTLLLTSPKRAESNVGLTLGVDAAWVTGTF